MLVHREAQEIVPRDPSAYMFRFTRVLLILAVLAAPALAVEDAVERARRAYALAGELLSPYCPGRTLADCPSPDAGALREEIRTRIDSGESFKWFAPYVVGPPGA